MGLLWRRGLRSWHSLLGSSFDCDRKAAFAFTRFGRFELSGTNEGSIMTTAFRVEYALEGALAEPVGALTSSLCDCSGLNVRTVRLWRMRLRL